jgi:hypothetical protein
VWLEGFVKMKKSNDLILMYCGEYVCNVIHFHGMTYASRAWEFATDTLCFSDMFSSAVLYILISSIESYSSLVES